MRPPVSASKRCLVSASSAAAPEKQILIDLKSTLPRLHVGVIQQRDVQRRHAGEERRLDPPDRREQIVEIARIRHERDRVAPLTNASACTPTLAYTWNSGSGRKMTSSQRPRTDDAPRLHLQAGARRRRRACRARPSACRSCRRSSGARPGRPAVERVARAGVRPRFTSSRCAKSWSPGASVMRSPSLLLAEQREQHAQERREVLLDVGRDDAPHARVRGWTRFTRCVEARQRDDGLDAVVAQRALELVLGVDRVERRDDRAELPRAELAR